MVAIEMNRTPGRAILSRASPPEALTGDGSMVETAVMLVAPALERWWA
jgi:hypothetical protein